MKSCTVLGILFVFNTTTQLLKHFLISQRVWKHVCQMISIYLFHQHEVPRVSISFFHQHRCACCFYLCSPPSYIYHRFACCYDGQLFHQRENVADVANVATPLPSPLYCWRLWWKLRSDSSLVVLTPIPRRVSGTIRIRAYWARFCLFDRVQS